MNDRKLFIHFVHIHTFFSYLHMKAVLEDLEITGFIFLQKSKVTDSTVSYSCQLITKQLS